MTVGVDVFVLDCVTVLVGVLVGNGEFAGLFVGVCVLVTVGVLVFVGVIV